MEILQYVQDEKWTGDQHCYMHESREEQEATKIFRRALTEEAAKPLLSLPMGRGMHILNGGQGQD